MASSWLVDGGWTGLVMDGRFGILGNRGSLMNSLPKLVDWKGRSAYCLPC